MPEPLTGVRGFLPVSRKLAVHAIIFSAIGIVSLAAEESEDRPDKSKYNLFNPTPEKYMRELSPDRPDKTDCPFTVDAGHFQLEMDFANATANGPNSQRGDVRFTSIEVAPMTLKLGVLNNFDVELAYTSYRWEKVENVPTGTTERTSGFVGLTPRCKINLLGNDGGFFALGLIPYVTFPVGAQDFTGTSVEGGLGIPYAFDVPGWDVGLQTTIQFSRNEVGGGYHEEIANSISIGHPIIGNLSLWGEFYSNVSTEQGVGWEGTVDIFLTYLANKNLRFDGGVNIGVTPTADDWHFWAGVTWRF